MPHDYALEQIMDFIVEIEKLKTVKRQNMTLDNQRQENSAEHSWHTAMMALVLCHRAEDMDRSRIVSMLLVHDLAEIYTGDTSLYDTAARKEAPAKEEAALKKLIADLPENLETGLLSLWREFEYGDSREAKYARCLDALQPLLNHMVTAPAGFNPQGLTAGQVREKKLCIKTDAPELWPFVEKAIAAGIARKNLSL